MTVYSAVMAHPESNSLIAGASIEMGLAKHLAIEVDGMYRPLHATDVPVDLCPEGRTVRFATLTWEFPTLLKYRFSTPKARPLSNWVHRFVPWAMLRLPLLPSTGITAGTGVEIGIAKLKVSPTFRFTRWAPDGTSGNSNAAHAFLNQAQLLLGISF